MRTLCQAVCRKAVQEPDSARLLEVCQGGPELALRKMPTADDRIAHRVDHPKIFGEGNDREVLRRNGLDGEVDRLKDAIKAGGGSIRHWRRRRFPEGYKARLTVAIGVCRHC